MVRNWKLALSALLATTTFAANLAYGQAVESGSHEASIVALAADDAPAIPARIIQAIDDSKPVPLRGNTHPLARAEFDQGLVEPQLPMERMTLLLKRSPEQEAALQAFMARQLDPQSPDFHHWLEPVEFGQLYGPSEADVTAVTNWLQNHGFTVDKVSNSRVFVEFSGTAGQVQQAFQTEIHRYRVKGEEHIANNSDPSIPEALSPVVAGLVSLHNFFAQPLHRDFGTFHRAGKTGKWTPESESVLSKPLFGVAVTGGTVELVAPYDFATIYNVLPLWNAGIDGTGQTIAIAGRSDISLTDVANFRSAFGLPAKAPTIITNGADPGVPSSGDKTENTLDVEWSGAVAKGAAIKFVTTASTATSDGAAESVLYIIDNKTAPVMSFSYGSCELAMGSSGNTYYNSLWQQAAAQGITAFVATGDQGSAACDGGQTAPYGAEYGLAVSGTSSTPYNVAVGGTDLNWGNNSGTTYWNSSNSTANDSSALRYIPEVPWNGTCASDSVDELLQFTANGYDTEEACQYMLTNDFDISLVNVVGGTGGVSACTAPTSNTVASCAGGYAKPSWQAGTGVPADKKRDVPDVSLFASSGALNSAYVICDSESTTCTFSNASDALAQAVGGTSVASPAMAGIMALINQKAGSAQGNANATLYALAAKDNRASCNSTSVASGNACNFYDITTDNNAVPCVPGYPNCTLLHTTDSVGILSGNSSTVGYDLATGLGSVNANNLVNNWPAQNAAPAVSLTPATLTFASTVEGASSAAQVVTLKNTGSAALAISSGGITVSGANSTSFSATTTCTATLAAGSSCTISVTFTPKATGTLTGTLSVADNATGSPQKVTLTGTGAAAPPTATLAPATLTFASATVGSTSAAQVVTLKNTSTSTLTITTGGITLSGTNASSFSETTTCGTTLAAAATCTISVSFKPTTSGTLTGTLNVADNATGSPQKVTLTGTGAAAPPTATLTPATLTFASTAVGSTSAAQVVTLKNTSTSTLTITTGGITLSGVNASSFSETTTCGTTLAAAATCTISVSFKPTTTGTLTGALSVADNATGSPQKVTLTGTGAASTSINVSPASLSFPNTVKGSTSEAQPVILANTGTSTVTISSISIVGTSPTSFLDLSGCGTTLAAKASCTVYVAFKPASAAALSASLSIADTASGSPQTVKLSGTGTAAPSVTLSTKSLTFAATAKGSVSEAQNVTLTNAGTSTLDLTSITLTGTNATSFIELNTCTPTLAPAASCAVYVAFAPAATGSLTASLAIADNGSGSPQTVALTGTGN
ncbi:MAG: choice-of-anchor D domain-containing protein [Terracidiphilus sp.]|jgi:subtilase family serine protease